MILRHEGEPRYAQAAFPVPQRSGDEHNVSGRIAAANTFPALLFCPVERCISRRDHFRARLIAAWLDARQTNADSHFVQSRQRRRGSQCLDRRPDRFSNRQMRLARPSLAAARRTPRRQCGKPRRLGGGRCFNTDCERSEAADRRSVSEIVVVELEKSSSMMSSEGSKSERTARAHSRSRTSLNWRRLPSPSARRCWSTVPVFVSAPSRRVGILQHDQQRERSGAQGKEDRQSTTDLNHHFA